MAHKALRFLPALAAAYLLALLAYRFDALPGLHCDEAWAGLSALRILQDGVFSPHGINRYTSLLFSALVSLFFRAAEPGVWSLRLPGLLLNAAGALGTAWHFARRGGPAQAGAWLCLLAGSALFVLQSRVAWEVLALQPFLLSLLFVSLDRAWEEGRAGFGRALLFLAACHAGVLSHFIFISVPLSLCVCLAASVFLLGERRRWSLGLLCLAALLQSAVVFLLKPALSEALWSRARGPLLLAFALLPPVFAVLYRWAARRWPQPPALDVRLLRTFRAAVLTGLAAFFLLHWVALLQVGSGVAVFRRLFAWDPPLALALPLYAWAAALLGLFFERALREVQSPDPAAPPLRSLLLRWGLSYAAVFPLFATTHAVRYYLLPSLLIAAALAWLLPGLLEARGWRAALPALAGLVLLDALLWRELAAPAERPPLRFLLATHLERSWDFQSLSPLERVLERERPCRIEPVEQMLSGSLMFLSRTPPLSRQACDPSKSLAAWYCPDCAKPPYFRWEIHREAAP